MEGLPKQKPRQRPRKFGKVLVAAGATAFAFGLAGCSANNTSIEHSSGPTGVTKLAPDMVRFLEPGTDNTCFNGGARPCAILIRTSPELSSDIINTNPERRGRVNWPLEAYREKPGDSLTVKCYDPNGQSISPYEGDSSSTYWYEVEMPERYVLNPVVEAELSESSSSIKTISQDGQRSVLGWASVEWFNQSLPASDVPVCAT